MSYQVLARKWRPQVFSDVVGQEHVLTALANGLSLGRLHHAYLFSGTRGVGKTTIARLLAKGLNCEKGITATPCGQCDNCREIEQGRYVDLIEIDAASRTRVEDTRELLDNVQYAPVRGRFKVYLIDEVHMLSRHSFNALLKTLEEPPEHVKFLLATTDPQKLPVTILSRCLQFHLKALDIEQIQQQLDQILNVEKINAESRALQLIARAAQGSLRDALSLLDQAISLGDNQVQTETVMAMLGTLSTQQPLALVEAIIKGDAAAVMSQLSETFSRGTSGDALLAEMLRLLHAIAMLQLLPTALSEEFSAYEISLRELARRLPPEELQVYYQILLLGRNELSMAPEPRIGVEMTLLRALAFHPQAPTSSVVQEELSQPQALQPVADTTDSAANIALQSKKVVTSNSQPANTAQVPDTTRQLLQARTELLRQGATQVKKSEPVATMSRPAQSRLQQLAQSAELGKLSVTQTQSATEEPESYRWQASQRNEATEVIVATPKALRSALEYEKTPELVEALAKEAQERDPWAAEIAKLALPKLIQQLALNSWKQQQGNQITLYLRSAQKHLNSAAAQKALTEALTKLSGETIELTIVADDNPDILTPIEWRQEIYVEKLAQAQNSVTNDPHIRKLLEMFDASLDPESIRPV